MTIREGNALDALLFGADGEELVDIKCFRGDREDVSAADIKREIYEGIMQYKMYPDRASQDAPKAAVTVIDVAEFVKSLPALESTLAVA